MKIVKTLLAACMMIFAAQIARADGSEVVRKSEAPSIPDLDELVIVGNDTVPLVIPERNFGRYHRGLYNYLFIPRGKWALGLTASYGSLQTDDVELLSVLSNIDFKGKMYSVKPFIAYFFRNNQSIGLRFNYNRGIADLNNLAMDFDEDLSFALRDVSYHTQGFNTSVFYRNYIGLNKSKRFGIFNEVDLTFGTGTAQFRRIYNNEPRETRTITTQGSINFSPGVCVFIQEYVSFNVSFGVFGLNFKREHQTTDNVDEGTRFTSGANFRFNIFNINFGLMVVI